MDYNSLVQRLLMAGGRESSNVIDKTVPPNSDTFNFRGNTLMDSEYPRDELGRWIVPKEWRAPPDFVGSVIQDGIQLDYAGPR